MVKKQKKNKTESLKRRNRDFARELRFINLILYIFIVNFSS